MAFDDLEGTSATTLSCSFLTNIFLNWMHLTRKSAYLGPPCCNWGMAQCALFGDDSLCDGLDIV